MELQLATRNEGDVCVVGARGEVDVFTARACFGNPVAVFLDADHLDAAAMQRDIERALKATTTSMPAGDLTSGSRTVEVRTGQFLADARDVGQLIVGVTERRPVMLAGREFQVGASLGVAMFPDHAPSMDRLIHIADLAMYEAKRQGKNRIISS